MAVLRAQVVFPFFTNLPSDVVTNTFHFFSGELTPFTEVADYLTPRLAAFYETCFPNGTMAPYMRPDNAVVRWYEITEPAPHVPYDVALDADITPASTNTLPTEVAMVLSFQGDPVNGIPQASRRGRIYIGGLSNAFMESADDTAFPTFSATRINAVVTAATTNLLDLQDEDLAWIVWSPTRAQQAEITHGWVDNSPDTQRRRSVDATQRTTWPSP